MNPSDKQIVSASHPHKKTKIIITLAGIGIIILLIAGIVGIYSLMNKKAEKKAAEENAAMAARIDAAFESIKDAPNVDEKTIDAAFKSIEGSDQEVTEDRINAAFESIQ